MIPKIRPIAVILSRFEDPRLNTGHIQLIAGAQAHAECVSLKQDMLIVICVPRMSSPRDDLFSFETRKAMLSTQLEGFPLEHILAIEDRANNDPSENSLWSMNLDELIAQYSKNRPVIIYGSQDCSALCGSYTGRYKTHHIETTGI